MNQGKLIEFKNTSDQRVVNADLGINCAPGETCMLPEAYALPRRSYAGGRYPSIVELVAPQMKPASADDFERFSSVPPEERPKRKLPTVADLVQAGMPEGLAEQMVLSMKAVVEASKEED